MAFVTNSISCCGLKELADISNSLSVAHSIKASEEGGMAAFLIFTDTERTDYEYGIALAKEITEHNLGTVTQTASDQVNPNSGRTLRGWIWSPDYQKIREYVSRETKDGRLKPHGVQQTVAKGPISSAQTVGRASDLFPRPPGNWARSLSYLGSALAGGRSSAESYLRLSDSGALRPGGAGGSYGGLPLQEKLGATSPNSNSMGVGLAGDEAEYWYKPLFYEEDDDDD